MSNPNCYIVPEFELEERGNDMNADDHKDVSIWISWFNEHGVFMSNAVLKQMATDLEIERLARELENENDDS